jgi:hypothetical protein
MEAWNIEVDTAKPESRLAWLGLVQIIGMQGIYVVTNFNEDILSLSTFDLIASGTDSVDSLLFRVDLD